MRAAAYLILATLFWAGNFVVGHAAMETMQPLQLTYWRWTLAAAPLLVLAQLVERPDWRGVLRRWPVLLLLSSLGMSAYTLLLYSALGHTSALNASLVTAANPALIVVLAVILLRDRPRPLGWAGIGLGLAGVLLVLTGGDINRLLTFSINKGELLILIAVFTALITVALGQPITLPQILGGVLVISGVLLTSAGGPQRPRSSKSTSSPPSPSPAPEFRSR